VFLVVLTPCALAHTDVTAQQAHDLIASTPDLVLVDVREPYEYCDRGHIPRALNYPWTSGVLRARYEELPKDGLILVVCQSGGRSNAAASFLDSNGFTMVYDMLRGMSVWLWETAPCKYSGGSGTEADPYQIATADDLITLGETPEDYDKHFTLTANIDLDPNLPGRKVFDRAVIAPDSNDLTSWEFEGTLFSGALDGNGHVISHLMITGGSYLGLFGQTGDKASISNVILESVDVNSSGWDVGGLVGLNHGSVTASCSTGRVIGYDFVGGLTGNNWGNIATSYNTSTVAGNGDVGGLVGHNQGSLATSYNAGMVTGNVYAGGLVGGNFDVIITSYSNGTVSGEDGIGGLVGRNYEHISTSYSTGTVNGNSDVGGLVGNNWGGIVTSSFWDVETSEQTTSAGGTGLTTGEMQDISIYLNTGWDFVDEVLNGTCDYWQISQGEYPRLHYHVGAAPAMPEGSGTAEQPYLIRDARDLGTVWLAPIAHYRMEAPVDLAGITWSAAVVPWFDGTFDGNGYVISNLHIEGGGYLGLFAHLGSVGKISDLGLEAVEIRGTDWYVGSLVGHNKGDITTSYSTGVLSGTASVGGLVGQNEGHIATSYSTGVANGTASVGGLAGTNHHSITSSYSTGAVSGEEWVGGLVGWNTGNITTSYGAGTVAGDGEVGGLIGDGISDEVINCFWDIATSGQETSTGGIGRTTSEMQMAGTFLEAGWDFVDETANGTDDIWWILEGLDYPRLWWQENGN